MLLPKSFSPALFVLALTFVTAIGLQTAVAEEENGISVGKLRFGKQTDDKWLKVDMRKLNRSTSSGPTVNTNSYNTAYSSSYRSASRPNYATTYGNVGNNSLSTVVRPTLPALYPPASTMVSNHKLLQAASIAVNSARGHSTGSCWRYVKSALLKAEAIDTYPKTGYAKQAASELVHDYGFVRTSISNPFSAPIGSVLVYGGAGAGHVEIRTRTGFVSDFVSAKPSSRPLIGVFVK